MTPQTRQLIPCSTWDKWHSQPNEEQQLFINIPSQDTTRDFAINIWRHRNGHRVVLLRGLRGEPACRTMISLDITPTTITATFGKEEPLWNRK